MRPALLVVSLLLAIPAHLSALEPPGTALRLERSRGGLPVVVAAVGGETLRFALDTGTSRSMIAASVAERLRLAPRAKYQLVTAAGAPRTALCAGPVEARIGGATLALDCLGWVPEERLLAGAEDVDGLLGADALASVDLWIDASRGRARIAPQGTLGDWVEGERLAVERVERRPAIRVTLRSLGRRGEPVQLVIDSGADRILLFGELARRTGSALRAEARPGTLATATATARVATVPLGDLGAGRMRLDAGWAGLLPGVVDRVEHGLLPLARLGPVLLDLGGGLLVARAKLRTAPAPAALAGFQVPAESQRGGILVAGVAGESKKGH